MSQSTEEIAAATLARIANIKPYSPLEDNIRGLPNIPEHENVNRYYQALSLLAKTAQQHNVEVLDAFQSTWNTLGEFSNKFLSENAKLVLSRKLNKLTAVQDILHSGNRAVGCIRIDALGINMRSLLAKIPQTNSDVLHDLPEIQALIDGIAQPYVSAMLMSYYKRYIAKCPGIIALLLGVEQCPDDVAFVWLDEESCKHALGALPEYHENAFHCAIMANLECKDGVRATVPLTIYMVPNSELSEQKNTKTKRIARLQPNRH